MALIQPQTAQGFAALPALRQLGLMVGLAASVAIGVAVVLWSQAPNYSLLYGNLDGADSGRILDELQKNDIQFKVDEGSGAVMVPAGEVHKARLRLAAQGLPKGNGIGFELLQNEQELGTSQFLEQARYQRAIEVELARSIVTMKDVENARVHLALPKRTVFLRKQEQPRASVVLSLYAGRTLGPDQVASIVHLVASSVPSLSTEHVTVVDQSGTLLTKGMQDKNMALTSSQFEYTRRLEDSYKQRIEDLISPVVGPGRVRAQVVADIDFTVTEKTHESYNPDLPALRSEQVTEDSSGSAGAAGGVPGALTNQPPAGGTLGEGGTATPAAAPGSSSSKRSIRNYELDRTISHIRSPSSSVRKLSVAVLVDDLQSADEDGVVTRTPLAQEQIDRLTSLVKEAVGFDAIRGDTISINNVSFFIPAEPEPLPAAPIWEEPWLQDVVKQVLGGLLVLILIFSVLRPVLRSLAEKGEALPALSMVSGVEALPGQAGQQGKLPAPAGGITMEENLTTAKGIASQDPARVAQVVKGWVASDGG